MSESFLYVICSLVEKTVELVQIGPGHRRRFLNGKRSSPENISWAIVFSLQTSRLSSFVSLMREKKPSFGE